MRLIPACAGKTSPETSPQRCNVAHPRVCGENSDLLLIYRYKLGSSPRVRGKQSSHDRNRLVVGLIPACAGKTPRVYRHSLVGPAHPRVCGENGRTHASENCFTGSSPRVRGKRVAARRAAVKEGLIPACAGKTLGRRRGGVRAWAHPRVCGENASIAGGAPMTTGSSPRVRGKLGGVCRRRGLRGLIPACAGKTLSHPRGTRL